MIKSMTIAIACCAVALAAVPAHAQKKGSASGESLSGTVKYCNQLPEPQCRKCAVARGFPASEYMTYCKTRR